MPSNREEEVNATEASLIARCLAGDPDAFQELYNAHATRLYNLAYRMSGTAAEAEDLLQEMFLQAFRKLSSFKGASTLGTWLYRLGMNLCLDRFRSKQGKMERLTVGLEDERVSPEDASRVFVGSSSRNLRPRVGSDVVIDRIDLERAIDHLPPSYRAAFLLHDVEGFEHHEIGTMLGIAEGTSKSLVHKARLRIRTMLKPEDGHEVADRQRSGQ